MPNTNRRSRTSRQRGAVAVEFALIAPLLFSLILGIVEFGRIYNAQVLVTNAAREAARTMAVKNNWTLATTNGNAVAPGYTLTYSSTPNPPACAAGTEMQVKASTTFTTISGSWFGLSGNVTVSGTGAMQCGG